MALNEYSDLYVLVEEFHVTFNLHS